MVDTKKAETLINAGTIIGSQYAQFVGVSITDIDLTLEFVFINPRDKTSGQVVSRVTVPLAIGVDLANTILMTAKMHANKQKGDKNVKS